MSSLDLNKYKNSWKSGSDFSDQRLSETQIRRLLTRESKDQTRLFKRSILFDVFLKSAIVLFWVGIMISFPLETGPLITVGIVLMLLMATIGIELSLIKKIPQIDYAKEHLQEILKLKTHFFRWSLYRTVFTKGLSAPLFIISGMTGWFLIKHDSVRILDLYDFLVLGAFVLAGFLINTVVEFKQHVFQISQLETTLNELNTNGLSMNYLEKQKNIRWRRLWMFILAAVCGLLLFGLLFLG
jgi:hypothetical protein